MKMTDIYGGPPTDTDRNRWKLPTNKLIYGINALLCDCVFHDDGTAALSEYEFDGDIVELLPHVYVVCISDGAEKQKVTAAFILRTTFAHDDECFPALLEDVVHITPALDSLDLPNPKFHVAMLDMEDEGPLDDGRMKMVLLEQYLKFNYFGSV